MRYIMLFAKLWTFVVEISSRSTLISELELAN
jgi:hypothetical protein